MYANKDFTAYLYLGYNNYNTLYEPRHQVEPDLQRMVVPNIHIDATNTLF